MLRHGNLLNLTQPIDSLLEYIFIIIDNNNNSILYKRTRIPRTAVGICAFSPALHSIDIERGVIHRLLDYFSMSSIELNSMIHSNQKLLN